MLCCCCCCCALCLTLGCIARHLWWQQPVLQARSAHTTHTCPSYTLPDHQGAIVGIENPTRRIYGLQYHPEVVHSERGKQTLHRFLFDLGQLTGDWKMESVLQEEMDKIRAQVGPTDHVICALSGGVDSTVAATLVHRVLGDRLHCVFVDNGLLRYNEAERVMTTFQEQLHLPVTKVCVGDGGVCVDVCACAYTSAVLERLVLVGALFLLMHSACAQVDDSERMLAKLKGLADPEAKRKAIGAEFIQVRN